MNFINLIIYFAVTFLIFLSVYLFIKSKTNLSLIDQDYNKPQAFHKDPVPRCGGLAAIISLVIYILINHLLFDEFLNDYFFLPATLFLIGFLDDLKLKINATAQVAANCCLAFLKSRQK